MYFLDEHSYRGHLAYSQVRSRGRRRITSNGSSRRLLIRWSDGVAACITVSEHRDVTDPVLLRAILRVHDREGYWWVECGTCDYGWQVPHYAAESVG